MSAGLSEHGVVLEVLSLTARQRRWRRIFAGLLTAALGGPFLAMVVLVVGRISRDGWATLDRSTALVVAMVLCAVLLLMLGFLIVSLGRLDRDRRLEITREGLGWRWRGQVGRARWSEISSLALRGTGEPTHPAGVLCITLDRHAAGAASPLCVGTALERSRWGAPVVFDLTHMTDISVVVAIEHYAGRTVATD